MKTCEIQGCGIKIKAWNLCRKHYERQRLKDAPECSVVDCHKSSSTAGMCSMHYSRQNLEKRPLCTVVNCKYKQYAHGVCRRHYQVQRTFGIEPNQYEEIKTQQENKCAICQISPRKGVSGVSDHLYVDHDHETGQVRGLLCRACNAGLGLFKDDQSLMRMAIAYLDIHSIREALSAE